MEKLKAEIDYLKAQTAHVTEQTKHLITPPSQSSVIAPKQERRSGNLIISSQQVPIFTKGQSRLTITLISNALIVDFSNDQTWSGIAFVLTPKLDVQEFTHLNISGIATRSFTFQIEYKIKLDGGLKIVTSSSFQSFPATELVSTIRIPLRYEGKIDEFTLMFYETGEASHITIEAINLSN
jgi:hypothetical protein